MRLVTCSAFMDVAVLYHVMQSADAPNAKESATTSGIFRVGGIRWDENSKGSKIKERSDGHGNGGETQK